jgi:hypothetical protein
MWLLLRLLITAVALFVATAVIPGIQLLAGTTLAKVGGRQAARAVPHHRILASVLGRDHRRSGQLAALGERRHEKDAH